MNLRKNNNVTENVKGMHDRAGHCIPYNKVLKHVVLLPCKGACSIKKIKKKTHTHARARAHTHTHRRSVPRLGRTFLVFIHIGVTKHTFTRSFNFTETKTRENCGFLTVPRPEPVEHDMLTVHWGHSSLSRQPSQAIGRRVRCVQYFRR